jgi:hypothetical protein
MRELRRSENHPIFIVHGDLSSCAVMPCAWFVRLLSARRRVDGSCTNTGLASGTSIAELEEFSMMPAPDGNG